MSGPVVRGFATWWLTEVPDIIPLLRHPSTQWRDARGKAWHVLDYDPTAKALRQRALPAHDDLSEPVRISNSIGAPGHLGRKRGELKVSRSALQHSGSGVWLDMQVEPGNGDRLGSLAHAVTVAKSLMSRLEHPLERAVLRADGEFGGLPCLAMLKREGMPFVTRLSRYGLLERPEVRRILQDARWVHVGSSGSGPQRSAADVGWVWLEPSGTREEIGDLTPQRVRVVISRYPVDGRKSGRGKLIDGVVYELFGTVIDAESWPAESVVELYYGRCAQECRFSQEDRELELDRIFAYHGPGQELACVIGAFVWNWMLVAGFRTDPPPDEQPEQGPANPQPDQRDLKTLSATETEESPEVLVSEVEDDEVVSRPPGESGSARQERMTLERTEFRKVLPRIFPTSTLAERGWTCHPETLTLRCPRGESFGYQSISRIGSVRFTGPPNVCKDCPLIRTCRTRTWRKGHAPNYKPALQLGPADTHRATRAKPQYEPRAPAQQPPLIQPATLHRGERVPTAARFLPAEARKLVRETAARLRFSVQLDRRERRPPAHRLAADSQGQIRHSRTSRSDQQRRAQLPGIAVVRVTRHYRGPQPPPLTGAADLKAAPAAG